MLGNMADPKAIGPAWPLLCDNYVRRIIANIVYAAVKLEGYTVYEVSYRELVVIGLRNIARSESPATSKTRWWPIFSKMGQARVDLAFSPAPIVAK